LLERLTEKLRPVEELQEFQSTYIQKIRRVKRFLRVPKGDF
jgi:hypothetical protein